MSTTSPPPNSSLSAVPPVSNTSPPPSTSSPPPSTSVPPPPQTNASPPDLSTPSAQSPPPAASSPPPPAVPPPPRQPVASPPPTSPPPNSSSPPPSVPRPAPGPPPNSQSSNPSPPPTRPSPVTPPNSPPPNTLSPPPPSQNSTPPPSSQSPKNSPPSPPPPSQSPKNSPPSPPPPSQSPKNSPPPPFSSQSPKNSPPPPSPLQPPKNSPPSPPPTSESPKSSPPPPPIVQSPPVESPANLPPAPASSSSPSSQSSTPPSSQLTPPSPPSNSTQNESPPSVTKLAPPPRVSVPSSDTPTGNNTSFLSPESSNSSGNGGIGVAGAAAIGVAVGIIVVSLIGIAVCCWRKQKRKHSRQKDDYVLPSRIGPAPRSDSFLMDTYSAPVLGSSSSSDVNSTKDPGGLGNSRSWFTYDELGKATNGFSEHNLLGEGGFGAVYKGCLPDGREVAVKQLKIGGGQGEREFKAEVKTISRIHHRHLVSLVGYCISDNQRLLVYDYVPNNNLFCLLHGEGMPVLDWPTRVKIAAGAARGIAYLHEDCHPRIIHRDIKSSNILLDNNFDARVSDFGLAKLALDGNTHISTRVMGTFGYMAPEYATSGKLTDKSDVFSFGVVLLELITGRKPVDRSQPLGDESLVEWARPLLSHAIDTEEYESLADPRLAGNYVESEMFRMIEAAAACVRHSAAKRPRMGQIVRAFESLGMADLSNGMRVGESEVFNSARQSEEIRWFQRMAFGSQHYSTDYFSDYTGGSEKERNTVHVETQR